MKAAGMTYTMWLGANKMTYKSRQFGLMGHNVLTPGLGHHLSDLTLPSPVNFFLLKSPLYTK